MPFSHRRPLFCACLFALMGHLSAAEPVWIDQLDLGVVLQDVGTARINKSFDRHGLSIGPKDLAEIDTTSEKLPLTLPAHGVVLTKISRVP